MCMGLCTCNEDNDVCDVEYVDEVISIWRWDNHEENKKGNKDDTNRHDENNHGNEHVTSGNDDDEDKKEGDNEEDVNFNTSINL